MATKVLQINPQLFKTGKKDSKKIREKKQKPTNYQAPSTLRKALLGKIRDFQKKEKEGAATEAPSKTAQQEEDIKKFDTEFNKSLEFLQELSKRHNNTSKVKKEKKQKNKTLKQALNGGRPLVSLDLPSEFLENSENIPGSIPAAINHVAPATNVQIIPATRMPAPAIAPMSVSMPAISLELPPNIPSVIAPQTNPIISQVTMPAPALDKNQLVVNTIKEPPPYSNLKGGNLPTYREWTSKYTPNNYTQKKGKHIGNPSITIQNYKPEHREKTERERKLEDIKKKYKQQSQKNKSTQLVKVKTRTIKYNLGKKGKTVGILIKNRQTRKKIKDEHALLKQKTLADVKDYLREKNLIKAGTLAPTDVLRTLYEQSILTGDVTNKSKETLLHNFINS